MFKTLNQDLYRPEKKYYLESLNFAKNLDTSNSKLVFHCFWRVPRDFGRKQVAVLKSIISSHIDQLNNIEINLWSNIDLTKNEYLKEVLEFINFRIWNLNQEIKGTTLEDCHFLQNNNMINDSLCYLEGDLFRLLVLNKYGGFYIDMDVLVLRNMSPLNSYEFLYQWGTSGYNQWEPNMQMNGAIMRLDKNSETSKEYLEILKNTPPVKDSFIWGTNMYSKLKNDIWILPGVWFNSEWGFEDTKLEPFKKTDKVDLFEGAFTWHWHNKWDDVIEEGSKFQILEYEINKKFEIIKNNKNT
jgi:hypothetical protein